MKSGAFGGVVLAALAALTVAACGAADGDAESSDAQELIGRGFTAATYNAGLAHGAVALAEQRLPRIAEGLASVDADVLCLQEVWNDDDYEVLRSSLAPRYPHAFRERTEEGKARPFACNPVKLLSLDRCVKSECASKGISTFECVATVCKDKYEGLSDRCKLCLAANTDAPVGCAFWWADEFAYNGRNGLALFSKHPIEDATFTPYDTVVVKRGVITAKVNGRTVQCTHMSSDLAAVPYPKDRALKSFAEENAQQRLVMEQAAAGSSGCRVAMGDLNTGPAVGTIEAELPATYAAFLAAGWREAWPSPVCTWCKDNPLTGAKDDQWIDHVLVKDCPGTVEYRRVMDAPITVDVGGKQLETRMSDHFGLLARIGK